MRKISFFVTLVLFFSINTGYAHGDKKHNTNTKKQEVATVVDSAASPPEQTVTPEEHAKHEEAPASIHASIDDFPNKHPLFVHFPIVLLLVAAAVQLANVIFLKKELDWITTILTIVSFGMAYYVTKVAHPHTTGLTDHAKLVLEQHDFYADWTIYLGGIATVAQPLNQFLFKGKRWSVVVVALLLAGAAYCVSMAGHYGAQLVHLEGVGPQGKYLEAEHGH
jgi:uncharacterized membrane protein